MRVMHAKVAHNHDRLADVRVVPVNQALFIGTHVVIVPRRVTDLQWHDDVLAVGTRDECEAWVRACREEAGARPVVDDSPVLTYGHD